MLKKELLDIICCPQCQSDLSYDAGKNTLTCTSCGTVFDIKDEIPILLPKNDGQ